MNRRWLAPVTCALLLWGSFPRSLSSARADERMGGSRILPLTGRVLTLNRPLPGPVYLPTERFRMGSTHDEVLQAYTECSWEPLKQLCDPKRYLDETPEHRVLVSGFWLDRTEVSVADYERCVRARRCSPLPYHRGAQHHRRPSLPVSMVTWQEATEYCNFRSARLPTEAEFERAARGRAQRRYPWGNAYNPNSSNHGRLAITRHDDLDGHADLAPVGSYPAGATPEGVLDLAGNVAEWISDRYAPQYSPTASKDPRGPSEAGTLRVVRGGSFYSPRPDLRGAARQALEPGNRLPFVGFRCARRSP